MLKRIDVVDLVASLQKFAADGAAPLLSRSDELLRIRADVGPLLLRFRGCRLWCAARRRSALLGDDRIALWLEEVVLRVLEESISHARIPGHNYAHEDEDQQHARADGKITHFGMVGF